MLAIVIMLGLLVGESPADERFHFPVAIPPMSPPIADLSLDLDNLWAYLRTHGDAQWETFPSYLPTVVPHFLEIFDRLNLRATVFVVGQDAALEKNHGPLRQIVDAGHEIGNHSFNHEPWLQRYSREQLVDEFEQTEAALAKITDQAIVGFRGPGFSLSADVLQLLCQRGYQFDGSTFPTFLGPMARAYYLMTSTFSSAEKEDRSEMFGSLRDGLRPLKPYWWTTPSGRVLELPVSTIPIVRAPFHFSYLCFLAQVSPRLAELYFRIALAICRLTRTSPSLLLHPLDFLGGDEVPQLSFFPGMKLTGDVKRAFSERMLAIYAKQFEVLPMGEHAVRIGTKVTNSRTF
ncbi:Peptidoglycan deacetylase [Rosistilla oblonga]|uniref:Peptidoglycan deacetylase n=2 Tax=Rosistilla oblonga TaxID=2527990 RepID=A0A518J262_9BACT|nr:Peptidoglycan deacetylase [Rosistilla oblonga]